MHSFQIAVPDTVKPEALLALLNVAVRSIPVASKLAWEQAQRDGADVSADDARRAVLLLRAWTTEAYFARASGTPSNTIQCGVKS